MKKFTTTTNTVRRVVNVIATVEVKDGLRDRYLTEFHKIVPLVREEEGCIEYGPTIDLQNDLTKDH